MPAWFLRTLTALLLSIFLAGCVAPTETDPDTPIEVIVGSEFSVVVKANPTTGYEWQMVEPPLDESVVRFVDKTYRNEQPVTIGSGGWDVWRFRAVGSGETTIHLGWFPPSGSATPVQVRSFTVRVR